MGTGDGLFVYRSARSNPRKFFIGIDANSRQLEKISEKIYRKPAKGGLPNVVFVQSAAEDLPSELKGIASEVYVNFPWGSLLRAVAGGNRTALINLRRICSVSRQRTANSTQYETRSMASARYSSLSTHHSVLITQSPADCCLLSAVCSFSRSLFAGP